MEPPLRKATRPPLAGEARPASRSTGSAAAGGPAQKKQIPPDQTHAENFYYLKQMQSKTPMVVVLKDGEELHGVIEWYDRLCLKVNREDGPNVLVFKHSIKYIYKEND
jgi:sRNA-binding regulator protein Hfq